MQCEVLTAEKASMASGLEAKDVQMESMQQEHSNVQTQLVLCQERVSQLQTELMQVRHSSGQAAFVVHLGIKQRLKPFICPDGTACTCVAAVHDSCMSAYPQLLIRTQLLIRSQLVMKITSSMI